MDTSKFNCFLILTYFLAQSYQTQHRYSIGNFGVLPALDIYHSPSLPPPPAWNFSWTPEQKKIQFDLQMQGMLQLALTINASTVPVYSLEYYIIWASVENQGLNSWNFSQVIDDMTLIRQQTNFNIVPYFYMQAMPAYIRNDYANYGRSQCLEHQLSTEYLSLFENTTSTLMNRFYSEVTTALSAFIPAHRDVVVRFSSVSDYGEVGFPAGNANGSFPVPHVHFGFWVQETSAQLKFRQYMIAKYGTIAALNAAWGTSFASSSNITFPNVTGQAPLSVSNRYWGDFITWYHDIMTNKTFELLAQTASSFYPNLNINFGMPYEPIEYGMDISALYKKCASYGTWARAPAGSLVPLFNTKRHATSFKMYRPPELSMEPVDGSQTVPDIGLFLFNCLTSGVTWNFDYPDNVLRAPTLYRQYDALVSQDFISVQHSLPLQDTAIFFSTIDYRLNRTRDSNGNFQQSYPQIITSFSELLRQGCDYDVVDELLMEDGILTLAQYNLLVWIGTTTYNSTLQKIMQWVNNGGIFAVFNLQTIQVYETGNTWWVSALPPVGQPVPIGSGYLFDAGSDLGKLFPFTVFQWKLLLANNTNNGIPNPLPLNTVIELVYITYFQEGILLFNNQNTPVNKSISMPYYPNINWRVNYPSMPIGWSRVVAMEPFQMIFLPGQNFTVASTTAQVTTEQVTTGRVTTANSIATTSDNISPVTTSQLGEFSTATKLSAAIFWFYLLAC